LPKPLVGHMAYTQRSFLSVSFDVTHELYHWIFTTKHPLTKKIVIKTKKTFQGEEVIETTYFHSCNHINSRGLTAKQMRLLWCSCVCVLQLWMLSLSFLPFLLSIWPLHNNRRYNHRHRQYRYLNLTLKLYLNLSLPCSQRLWMPLMRCVDVSARF